MLVLKDGSVRWCIDHRQLNQKTAKDSYPLPNIGDCLSTLSGSIYFSTLEMESGYYQVEIDPADRKKTAFITRFGLFEHVCMGFCLCNVPASFLRVIQLVLRGLTWKDVYAYLDDVNVLDLSFEEHLRNIDEVLERFQRYNLKLKPRKCFLFQTECEFLCKKISRDGVSISPAKLDAVKSWPVPTDKREVESILGYAN